MNLLSFSSLSVDSLRQNSTFYIKTVGCVLTIFLVIASVGHYHAPKKYLTEDYLGALAAHQCRAAMCDGNFYLVFPWKDNKCFYFNVETEEIFEPDFDFSFTNKATGTSVFSMVPMNDGVTQGLVSSGIMLGFTKFAKTGIKSGGNPRAKAIIIVGGLVALVSGYYVGDYVYYRHNPPGYSLEMETLLREQKTWHMMKWAVWHKMCHEFNPEQSDIMFSTKWKSKRSLCADDFLELYAVMNAKSDYVVSFSHIGVTLDKGDIGGVIIKDVLPNSPAEKSGLSNGDQILSIDETNVDEYTVDDVIFLLRTTEKDEVVIQYQRGTSAPSQCHVQPNTERISIACMMVKQ